MSINLSDRLSAITTDSAGKTHVVWEERGLLWHAVYDPNAEEWIDANAIVAVGRESVIGLNLVSDPSLVNLESDSTTTAPGLAVVWQQGTGNNSNFFYTGAQYDANNELQWLSEAQPLTSDQIGDLDPRSIIYQESGATNVLVVGNKVDIDKAANLSVTEDSDLYTQQFSLESSQFSSTDITTISPSAIYNPPLVNNGLINTGVLSSSTPQLASTQNASKALGATDDNSPYQGLGGSWGGGVIFDVYNFFTDSGLSKTAPSGFLESLLNRLLKGVDYAGVIQAGESFNGKELTLETNGSLSYNWDRDVGKRLGGKEAGPLVKANASLRNPSDSNTSKVDKEKNNFISISGLFDTTYTFEATSPYGLKEQDQTFGVSLSLTIPIASPYEDGIPGFRVNASFSVGFDVDLSSTPTTGDYYPQTFTAALEEIGTEALATGVTLGVGVVLNEFFGGEESKAGNAVAAAVAESAIATLANFIVGQTQGFDNDATIAFPALEGKLDFRLGFSWLNLTGSAGLDFAVNYPLDNDGDRSYISAGIPVDIGVRLGPLVFGASIDPTWQWDLINSSASQTTTFNDLGGVDGSASLTDSLQSVAGINQAVVRGSLLTIDFGSAYQGLPSPEDFTVTITRANGVTQDINVFNIITGNTKTAVILQLDQPIAPSQNLDYRDSNTPTPTTNKISVSFENSQNVEDENGNPIANISSLDVINQTPQTFAYTYSPTSGNSANYATQDSKSLIEKVQADLGQDSPPTLSLTETGSLLAAWIHEVPPITPIAGLVKSINGTTAITLNFIENLGNTGNNQPLPDQFTVTDTDNMSYTVTNVGVSGNSVRLTLEEPAASEDSQLLVSYQLSQNNLFLTDATGTRLWIDNFDAFQPKNITGLMGAPQYIGGGSIVQTETTNQITLVFDQDLTGAPSPVNFSVQSNSQEYTISPNIELVDNTLILTISPPEGSDLIGNGDVVIVSYNGSSVSGDDQELEPFTTQPITTAPAQPTTVLKTWIGTPGGVGVTESIPGSDGFNFTPTSARDQNGNNVLLWVHANSSDISTQLTPGEIYGDNIAQAINQNLDQSEIYYSIYDSDAQSWSLATQLTTQAGSDAKVTLGTGPNGNLMAAWLNYTDNTPTIYWSSLSYDSNGIPNWSAPEIVIASALPDELTELSINSLNGQPSIFWTETQPVSYSLLTLNNSPILYYRLDESSGTVLENRGTLGAAGNGIYSSTVDFKKIGALEDVATNTGDPNPAVYFSPGAFATMPNDIAVFGNSFTIEFWFKVDETPSSSLTLLTLEGLASVDFDGTELTLNIGDQSIRSGASKNNPEFAAGEWYYVVATYDGKEEATGLFVNGTPVGAAEKIALFTPGVITGSNIILSDKDNASGIYLDEVAYYKNVFSYSNINTGDLISPNLTALELLDIIAITDKIGNKYNSQYVSPLPPGPDTYYVVYDEQSSSWQSSATQISPLYRPVATALTDARTPNWDIVSSISASTTNTFVNPNGKLDTLYSYELTGSQGKTISGAQLVINGINYVVGDTQGVTGNQLGVVIGNTLINTLNPESLANNLSYDVMGQSLNLRFLIDDGSNSVSTENASLTIYFSDNTTPLTIKNLAPLSGLETPWNPEDVTVIGTATVTEANDSSLSLIDSGFPIDTTNPAMGYRLASGDFNNDGKLDVAVGNRGYTDSSGNVLSSSTIQILFNGGSVLSDQESSPLTPGDLSGNSNGVLITGIPDRGQVNGDLPLSLATGDVTGDGIDDLLIGAPNANNKSGSVYILDGSQLTEGQTIDLSNLDGIGYEITNPNENNESADLFGFSVAVGNFDGNMYADIVIGAPNANGGNGIVYAVYNESQTPNTTPEAVYNSVNSEEYAGYAVTVSVATNGGSSAFSGNTSTDDLIIGAPGFQGDVANNWIGLENLPPSTNALGSFPTESSVALGSVYLFQSSDGQLNNQPDYIFTGPALPSSQNQTAADLLAGSMVASQDWNGDAVKDLAISAPKANDNAGSVYLLKGGKANSGSLNTVSSLTLQGELQYSQTGQVLANAGDVNDDSYQDLLITTSKGASGTGQGYVVFGGDDLLDSDTTLTLSATSADNKKIMLLNGSQPNQLTGTAAAGIGDVNGDDVDDLMITAPNQFQLYTVYGHPWLADDGSLKLADISSDNGFITDGLLYTVDGNQLSGTGEQVSVLGDINGDGFADVLSAGSQYGSIITFGKNTQALIDAAAGTDQSLVTVENNTLRLSLALGDINGDGLDDIGFVDADNTFYVVLGAESLAANNLLTLSDIDPNLAGVSSVSAVGDTNGDGFDDLLIINDNSEVELIFGSTTIDFNNSVTLDANGNSVWGGVGDVNGDGYAEIGGGAFNVNIPTGQATGNGTANIYAKNQVNMGIDATFQAPLAPIGGGLNAWQTIVGENSNSLKTQTIANTVSYAEYNGYLYMLYNATDNDTLWLQRSADGVNWEGLTNLGSRYETKYQPSLAVFKDTLYLAFTATDNQVILAAAENTSTGLDVSFPSSGGTFFQISGNTSKNAPTLLASEDNLFVFFLANDKSDLILYNYAQDPGNASSWSSTIQVTGQSANTNGEGTAVSATINNEGNILLAFFANQGTAGNKFNTIIGNNPDASPASMNWTNFQTVSGQSTLAPPSVVSINDTAYLLFNGPGDVNSKNTINYLTSSNGGQTWSNFQQIPDQITQETSTPFFFNENLYVGFNASGTPNYINTSISNPLYEPNNTQQLGSLFSPIGDFNGDGIEDLAILAPGYISNLGVNYNSINENNQGAVFIYYGGGVSTDANPDLVLAAPAWGTWSMSTENPTFNRFESGSNQNENASNVGNGSILLSNFSGAGDINGDGFDDLVIASPDTDLDGNTLEDGLAFVVFGGDDWESQYSATNPFDLWNLSNNQTADSGDPAATNDQGFVILGLTTGAQAGISLAGGGDVNGDGLDDFILGAPGDNDSLTYTIFGSDFTSQINQTGTIGDDVMIGSPTGETFIANIGDDNIYSGGGIDVVYAGPGDDYITVSDTFFRRIDGGTGTDVIALEGYNSQSWDLTTLSPGLRLRDIEIIVTKGYGDNNIALNSLAVNRISNNNTLTLVMDPTDSLTLSSEFSYQGTVYQYNQNYAEYTATNSAARVLINQPVASVSFDAPIALQQPSAITATSINSSPATPLTVDIGMDDTTLTMPQNSSLALTSPQRTELFISNPVVNEANASVRFTVTRTGNIETLQSVIYRTQDGDGKAGNRYLPVAGTFVFAAGEVTKTIVVPIPNDGTYTGNREFSLIAKLVKDDIDTSFINLDQSFVVDAYGEQIRDWSYEQGLFENGVMGSLLQFSTTTTDASTQLAISAEVKGDFNDFYGFDPDTQSYKSLMIQGGLGATFSNLEDSITGSPQGVKLFLKDGDRGDADGIANGLVKTMGYVGRTIPGLITSNNQLFWAPTEADGQVQWRLISTVDQDYELGLIYVDDLSGSIEGLMPNDPGYEEAALARKQVIFENQTSASPDALSPIIAQNSFLNPRSLDQTEHQFFGNLFQSSLDVNQYYMLYSQNGGDTTFSINESPTIQSDGRGYHELAFKGITAEISSSALVVPGLFNQPVTLEISLSRAAHYQNQISLYRVDNLSGGLDIDGDRQIDLQPGDLGYAQAALNRALDPLTGVTLSTPENLQSAQEEIQLLGANSYGMVLIPNATIEQVLSQNPENIASLEPTALFSFAAANADGISYMSRLGANLFGFEDIIGGGDFDYNDMLLQVTPIL